MCDHPGSTVDDYLDVIRGKIRGRGWTVQYVEDRVPYAYTIGLAGHGLPEFLMTGVSPLRALEVLGGLAESAAEVVWDVDAPKPGARLALPGPTLIEVVEVEHPDAHMNVAIAIHGSEVRALQLVWADARGRWPWSPTFDNGRGTQPVLGVRAAHRGADSKGGPHP
ncbi:DUF4262 domain-containing protein [Mycobacterium sp.]|uniref:DUF4262 domain-containing protein n=1 Tax=Mycobacterium sp. TaxID=1785 RepID=UPI002C7C6CDD|nr:DUF4262 domain-containing protein [Mycobacterium sp.]HTY34079.1 DUF4262 domain-containing protein [Mycobacterium sp.]